MYRAPRSYQGSWYSGQTLVRLGTYEWLSGWSSSVYTILLITLGPGKTRSNDSPDARIFASISS